MIFSLVHFVIFALVTIVGFIIVGIPVGIILRRLGYSEWFALVTFIPFGALVGLWVLAYARWPAIHGRGKH